MAAFNYRRAPLLAIACLALAACTTTAPPPKIVTVETKIPVVLSCVTQDQLDSLPPEPGKVVYTNNAAEDIGPVAIAGLAWKKLATEAKALLLGCVGDGE